MLIVQPPPCYRYFLDQHLLNVSPISEPLGVPGVLIVEIICAIDEHLRIRNFNRLENHIGI